MNEKMSESSIKSHYDSDYNVTTGMYGNKNNMLIMKYTNVLLFGH